MNAVRAKEADGYEQRKNRDKEGTTLKQLGGDDVYEIGLSPGFLA